MIGFASVPVSRHGPLSQNWATGRQNPYAATLGGPPIAPRSILVSLATYSPSAKTTSRADATLISDLVADCEEVAIRQKMGRWAIDIGRLSGLLTTGQEMADVAPMEFYEARSKEPMCVPRAAPMLHGVPPHHATQRKGFSVLAIFCLP